MIAVVMFAGHLDAEELPVGVEGALEQHRAPLVGLTVDMELPVVLLDRQNDQLARILDPRDRSSRQYCASLPSFDDLGFRLLHQNDGAGGKQQRRRFPPG